MPSLRARRKAALALSSLALVASLALAGPAAAEMSGGLTYSLDSDQVTITGCDGDCPSSLVIPEKIGGNPVVGIGASAFANQEGITSVALPEGLTSIGENAFGGAGISSVTIPSTVTTLGRAAFQSMNNLASATFAEGSQIAAISDDLFRSDSSLKNVTLPATVTSIGGAAFLDDVSLTSLTFQGDAPTVGSSAFESTGAVAQLATKSLQGYGYNGEDFYGLTVAGGYSRPGTPGSFRAEAALVSNPLSTTVDFTLAEWPTGKVECRLNDDAWGDCTLIYATEGKFTVTNLTGGEQKISVRQTNGDGITSNVGSVYLAPKLIDAPVGLRTKTGVQFQVAHASNGVLWCEIYMSGGSADFRPCSDMPGWFLSNFKITITAGESIDGVTTDTINACSPACSNDGDNSLRFKQVIDDKASLVSEATWTQDTTGPNSPTLSGKPDSTTNSPSASIGFTSSETDATFECSVDDGDFAACTSPKSLKGLPDGAHSLAVRGVDSLGNVGAESKTTWTVDTTAPAAPTLTSPANSSTSGPTAPFVASEEQGSKLMCSLDGGEFVKCPAPNAAPGDQATISVGWNTRLHWGESQGWSKLHWGVSYPPSQMYPGGYPFWQAADMAATDFPDGVTPSAIWLGVWGGYYGSSCEDNYALLGNSGYALLVGVPLEGHAPAVYSRFTLDCSSTLAEVQPPAPAQFTSLSNGRHTLAVKVVDKAGNESSVTTTTWTVGNPAHSAPVLSKVGLKFNPRTKVTTLTLKAAADTRVKGNSVKWVEYFSHPKRPA
ncbi:MAG: leucine-rich repeat domain-containing protein, partial [Solirubrobacterales bacterium]|nr:leucine-rich repeat domain-containing protein [Solirubrobacterales bacterium]